MIQKGATMITIDENKCTLCELCVPVCVRRILAPGETSIVVTDPSLCHFCGQCKAVCPTDAPQFSHLNEEEFEPIPEAVEAYEPSAFLRFLRRRRSLRVYQKRPVEEEKLRMILEAGRFAPTEVNHQGCEYVVVNGRKTMDQVCFLAIQGFQKKWEWAEGEMNNLRQDKKTTADEKTLRYYLIVWDRIAKKWKEGVDQFLHNAPALIIIHIRENLTSTPGVDTALAAMPMVLMAETLGLGTCINGNVKIAVENSEDLRRFLKIPADHRVHVAFTVGYPDIKYLRMVARNPARIGWIKDSAKS